MCRDITSVIVVIGIGQLKTESREIVCISERTLVFIRFHSGRVAV